jgi:sigma-B regulation protein RsbU (phosphoserine phosphatase)
VGVPGTLLGVIDPIRVQELELELKPGDTLLLYTDGVLEAGSRLGENGLLELCRDAGSLGLEDLLGKIQNAVLRGSDGHLRDDLTLLGLRMLGPRPSPR